MIQYLYKRWWNMKVSIVVPVYNSEKYLEKCLDSIINQTYDDIEVILIDDGSSDRSLQICNSYAKNDERIIVNHQKNSGVSTARNNGIKLANGKYICFVDSDDIVHKDYIKKLVDNTNKNTLAICQIEKFNENINFSSEKDSIINLSKKDFIDLCRMFLLNTPCCKLYNLDIIRKNNISFDKRVSLGEDLLFNLDYLDYIEKIVIIEQKLYYYRVGNTGTLTSIYNPKIHETHFLLFDKYTEFFGKISMNNDDLIIYDSYRFNFILSIIDNEFSNKELSFWQNYHKVKKLLKKDKMQSAINKIRYPKTKIKFFLIKHKLLFVYILCKKIRKII